MSNRQPLPNESAPRSSPDVERRRAERRLPRSLTGPAQFLSFWLAIALPFVHLPLLAQGLGDPTILVAFLALLSCNVLALYAGHGYNQESADAD